jgi:hypothetical protein
MFKSTSLQRKLKCRFRCNLFTTLHLCILLYLYKYTFTVAVVAVIFQLKKKDTRFSTWSSFCKNLQHYWHKSTFKWYCYHQILPMTAQIQSQISPYGICSGQSEHGKSFLRLLQSPLPILIKPIAPFLLSII